MHYCTRSCWCHDVVVVVVVVIVVIVVVVVVVVGSELTRRMLLCEFDRFVITALFFVRQTETRKSFTSPTSAIVPRTYDLDIESQESERAHFPSFSIANDRQVLRYQHWYRILDRTVLVHVRTKRSQNKRSNGMECPVSH